MKTIVRPARRTSRNFEAFFGGISLPAPLKVLSHCTRPCHLRDMPGHHQTVAKWAPPLAVLTAAFVSGAFFPGWIFMWIVAGALFASAKWITIVPILCSKRIVPARRLFAYCILWTGLNAAEFLDGATPAKPMAKEWRLALAKTLFGCALIAAAVAGRDSSHTLLIGWTAMIGIVFLLHFGSFHLLALYWQSRGVNAQPIMNMPLGACSLGKFWSARWNRAFSDLAHDQIFRPMSRRFSGRVSLLMVFLISGLLHESVISVPAFGGYGLPTGYFLLQGLGHFAERSDAGRQIGLGHGWIGWSFVVLVAGLPAFVLFPPVFVHNVILPMLHAL